MSDTKQARARQSLLEFSRRKGKFGISIQLDSVADLDDLETQLQEIISISRSKERVNSNESALEWLSRRSRPIPLIGKSLRFGSIQAKKTRKLSE